MREPDDVAQTLTKILTDLDPRSVEQDTEEAVHQLVYSFPGSVRERLSLLFKARQLPLAWAIDQTLPISRRPTSLERWGHVAPPPGEPGLQDERAFAAAVLERIRILAAKAEDAVNRSAARAEQQRNQQRRIKVWGFGALAFAALVIVGTLLVQDYAAKRGAVERLITFAERDPSPNIRLRILLLLNALDRSEGIANVFIRPRFAERALRRTLARSPVMGGGYQAIGVNADGTKLALVAGQSLRVHTVDGRTATGPALPITFPEQDNNAAPPATYRSGFFEPLSAGFLRHPDLGEIPAAYRMAF